MARVRYIPKFSQHNIPCYITSKVHKELVGGSSTSFFLGWTQASFNIEGPLKIKKQRYQVFNCILLARKCICTSEMPLVGIFCPALCSKLWGAFSKIFKTCLKYTRQYLVSNFFYLLCFSTAVISRPELTPYIEKHFFKVQK